MIEAVIFDMDGVLINSEPYWQAALINVFKELGIDFTREMAEETMGIRIDEVIAFRYEQFQWQGKSQEEVVAEVLTEVERQVQESGVLMDGVLDILTFFQDRQVRIGLASSSAMRIIDTIVDHLGLRSYFEILCSAETEPYGKPHPAIYLTAAEKIGIPPTRCLAIEDSFNGLIAAKAARMKTFVVPDIHFQQQERFNIADLRLTSLADFENSHWQMLQQS